MSVEQIVKEIFLEQFGLVEKDFSFDKTQEEFVGWDSLTHLELVSKLESEFKLEFDFEDVVEVTTPRGFLSLVEKK